MAYTFKFLLLVSFFWFIGCEKPSPLPHPLSFYYWKSQLALTKTESNALEKLKVDKLYVKFFDIKLDQASRKIVPVAIIQADSNYKAEKHTLVPCVFIENQVWPQLDSSEMQGFAQLVVNKLSTQFQQFQQLQVQEIHVDSDWTRSTSKAYFQFLHLLQTISEKQITCTIRLHQVKYANQTGVPPVSKGILMCYNIGTIQDVQEKNSIFDLTLLKTYTKQIDSYSLKLDVALPIYEWSVLFRNNRFVSILSPSEYIGKHNALQHWKDNLYKCVESSRMGNKTVLKGDVLRIESVSDEDLKQSVKWFDDKLKNYTIVFYHLEEHNLRRHEGIFHSIPTF